MTDVFLVGGVRTPIGRYGGGLAPVRPDDLAAQVLGALVARWPVTGLDDVVFGCANQAGEDNRNVARMAVLLAGLPEEVPGSTVNRLCGSGLDAVATAARAIRAGEADIVVAGGVESMSRAPFVVPKASAPYSRTADIVDTTLGWRLVNPLMQARYGTDSLPRTAENVAAEFGVSRADQDGFAVRSHQRAASARERGRLAEEILPVAVHGSTLADDEHPRPVSAQRLARLPALHGGGTVTAGNSSGLGDGAAALLLASGRALDRYGFTPLARIDGARSAGVPPRIMGIGPVPATRALLDRHGLAPSDVDVLEVNEAFAAPTLAVLRALGIPDDAEHVNPNGGAIALGHPLGMTGARLVLTAAVELVHRGAHRALATACTGVGQGIALLLSRP